MQNLFLLRVAAEIVSTERQMGTFFGLHIWTLFRTCIEVLIYFFINLEHVDQSV